MFLHLRSSGYSKARDYHQAGFRSGAALLIRRICIILRLCRLFLDIQDVELTSRAFGQVQPYRNTQFYDFLLRVCELICRNLLVSEKPGTSKLMDFVWDRREMAALFEGFVRTSSSVHTDLQVKREDIYSRWIAADQVGGGWLVP